MDDEGISKFNVIPRVINRERPGYIGDTGGRVERKRGGNLRGSLGGGV